MDADVDVTARNNLVDQVTVGFLVQGRSPTSNSTVQDNVVNCISSGNAIVVNTSLNLQVLGNTILDCSVGISLASAGMATVSNNSISVNESMGWRDDRHKEPKGHINQLH